MIQRLIDIKTDATAAFEKESKTLLVRLDENFLMLALADKETGTWQAAEILSVDAADRTDAGFVSNLKQKSSLVNYKGLAAQVLIATSEAMPLPQKLANDAAFFLQTQVGEKATGKVFTDVVNDDIVVAFAASDWQMEIVQTLFPEAAICSTLALLTKQSLANAKNGGTCLYLHLGKTHAELVLIKESTLSIARSLPYGTEADLLYHLLNIARQFSINPTSLSIQLQGQVKETDTIYQLLETYFAPVSFAQDISAIRHKMFWQVPPHFFTGLMQTL